MEPIAPKTTQKNKTLLEVLLEEQYIQEADYQAAIAYSKKTHQAPTKYLISNGIMTRNLLGQAVAEHYQVNFWDLEKHQPAKTTLQKLPQDLAKKHHVLLVEETPEKLVFVSDQPHKNEMITDLQNFNAENKKIIVNYALTEQIEDNFRQYQQSLSERFTKIIEGNEGIATHLFEEIVHEALNLNTSDIHLEPQKNTLAVRFRIDGLLTEVAEVPLNLYENLLNKIRVLAKLPIDSHFDVQDGAIRFTHEDQEVDLRISIIPTLNGEKTVLRVLSKYVDRYTLSNIGVSENQEKLLSKAASKPFGMILVAGPTGSGKTTTLYTLLKQIKTPEINVTTIEDPVEYKVVDFNQIQYNAQNNLTFARGLRSIVRQDPDVILVGEIRDQETLEISINASLTGHLLFSTVHANDAATVVPRMIDMGAEPFLLASTLELIVSQRLVRKICDHCRYSLQMNSTEISEKYPALKNHAHKFNLLFAGKGCSSCNNSGYSGRSAIFEVIEITPEIENLILSKPSSQEIWNLAQKQGSKSMFENGIEKVQAGITTLEELLRVAPPSHNFDTEKISESTSPNS